MVKVLIVDDMRIARDCMKMAIESNSNFEVVGCACNGLEAIEMCEKYNPDIILMDIIMPKLNGIDAIIRIKNQNKKVKILVLSSVGDEENIINSIKNGADGYVLKDIGIEELILAIESINKGLSFIHKNAYSIIIMNSSQNSNKIDIEKQQKINRIFDELTNRERSVFKLLAEGMSNEEMAVTLDISEGRVRNVVSSLISKFMFESRTQLAVTAVKFYNK